MQVLWRIMMYLFVWGRCLTVTKSWSINWRNFQNVVLYIIGEETVEQLAVLI
ncbi:hypothetical protein V1478_018408 [Vespula squamosa]|uniref:Uncharacterized protein n=1 Tax=Vespula squamosa TaxID=30214 RepID=A0ABD1ZUZ5_VESSQ